VPCEAADSRRMERIARAAVASLSIIDAAAAHRARTRAFDFSPALAARAESQLMVQAGVDASLRVFDGLGHSFYNDAPTPEAVDAYDTMVRFVSKAFVALAITNHAPAINPAGS
jgi:hypothetical protein